MAWAVGVAGGDECRSGHDDRGEERARHQGAAHLLEHDLQLGEAVAVAAVFGRQGQGVQPELFRHPGPHALVVRGVVVDDLAHVLLTGLRREEVTDPAAQLVERLLVGHPGHAAPPV